MAEGGKLNEEHRQTFILFRMLGFDMRDHLQFLYLGWCPLGATQVQQGTAWLMTNKKKSSGCHWPREPNLGRSVTFQRSTIMRKPKACSVDYMHMTLAL